MEQRQHLQNQRIINILNLCVSSVIYSEINHECVHLLHSGNPDLLYTFVAVEIEYLSLSCLESTSQMDDYHFFLL